MRVLDAVYVTAKDLTGWAESNGVDLRVAGDKLPIVNARRTALGLPPFKVIKPTVEQTVAIPRLPLIAATEAELKELINTFSGTRTGLMTGACATWGLKFNTGNRVLERSAVARFSNIIRQGQWLNTSEPVIFSRSALNDGQHRLTAIAQTGIPVEIDVRFGIERDAFMATNTGARRTAGQALHILGAKNAIPQASIARLLFLYDQGRLGETAGRVVETSDIIATVNAVPAIPDVADFMVRSNFAPTRTAPFGFVLAAAARATTINKALAFGAAVASGRASDGDPSRALHVRLRDMRMKAKNLGTVEVAALTVQAWNGWLAGKPVQLRLTKDDQAPGAFPRVQGNGDD